MNRMRWMVVALVVGVGGIAAFHPLGGEGSAAAEASTGIGLLGLLSFIVLAAVSFITRLRGKRSSALPSTERVSV